MSNQGISSTIDGQPKAFLCPAMQVFRDATHCVEYKDVGEFCH